MNGVLVYGLWWSRCGAMVWLWWWSSCGAMVVRWLERETEKVCGIEKSIANGNKVPEVQITTLIEMLMRQAVKLDAISVQGEVACAQRNLQGKRVQKCVESLDVLKVSNTKIKPVVVTTKWETFDSPPSTAHWEFFD